MNMQSPESTVYNLCRLTHATNSLRSLVLWFFLDEFPFWKHLESVLDIVCQSKRWLVCPGLHIALVGWGPRPRERCGRGCGNLSPKDPTVQNKQTCFEFAKQTTCFFFACSVCCFQSRTWSVMWLWIILHRRCHVWAVRLWRAPLRLQWVDGELWLMQLPTERGVGAECDQKPRRLKHLKNVNTSGWKMLNAEDVSAFLRVAGCDCAFAEATSFRPLPKVSAARATSLSRSLYVQSFAGADAHEAVQNVQCLGTAVPLLSHLELRGMPRNVSEWNVYWCN